MPRNAPAKLRQSQRNVLNEQHALLACLTEREVWVPRRRRFGSSYENKAKTGLADYGYPNDMAKILD
eukprot:scaffold253693_cov43-Prasinocladus_malaysianus.AAC.2